MTIKQKEPRFETRRSGYGLTPISWQDWCTTLVIVVVLLGSVQVVLYLVRDPLDVVVIILIVTAVELAVFVPLTYRNARSLEEAEKSERKAQAQGREQVKRDLDE